LQNVDGQLGTFDFQNSLDLRNGTRSHS
jgi:hypothetical protein